MELVVETNLMGLRSLWFWLITLLIFSFSFKENKNKAETRTVSATAPSRWLNKNDMVGDVSNLLD